MYNNGCKYSLINVSVPFISSFRLITVFHKISIVLIVYLHNETAGHVNLTNTFVHGNVTDKSWFIHINFWSISRDGNEKTIKSIMTSDWNRETDIRKTSRWAGKRSPALFYCSGRDYCWRDNGQADVWLCRIVTICYRWDIYTLTFEESSTCGYHCCRVTSEVLLDLQEYPQHFSNFVKFFFNFIHAGY